MKIYLGSKAKHLSNASLIRNWKSNTPANFESKIKNSRNSERFEARKAAENEAKDFLLSSHALFQFPEDSHYADAEDDAEDDWQDPQDDPNWQALDDTLDEFQHWPDLSDDWLPPTPYHDFGEAGASRLNDPQNFKDSFLCRYELPLPTLAVDEFMQGIHDFLGSDQRNTWIETKYGNIYVRKSAHHLDGRTYKTLDLANLDLKPTNQGIFTRLYNRLVDYLETTSIEAIYVENVMTQRFERKLLSLGLVCQDFSALTPSYYKVIT